MSEDYDLISVDVAEPVLGAQVGKTVLRVHGAKRCAGQVCAIHNPSDHRMVSWPQNWRGDTGVMERLCSHGVGHPDPDDKLVRETSWAGVHGCDGCCRGAP